jgi:hypothetical protein
MMLEQALAVRGRLVAAPGRRGSFRRVQRPETHDELGSRA